MRIQYSKSLFILFYVIHFNCFTQQLSPEFNIIVNDTALSIIDKNIEFNKLLKTHNNQNKIDFLLGDRFEIIKWNFKQGFYDRAIALNKKNLELMDSLNFKNKRFYRRNLYSLGFYEKYNYNPKEGLIIFKKLLTYNKSDKYALQAAFQIAKIYFKTGNYYLSRDYFKLSKTIAEDQNNEVYIVKNAISIAEANKKINSQYSLREGINVLTEVISFTDSIKPTTKIKPIYMHSMYNQLGNLYIDRLDYDFENGKLYLDKALKIAEKINSHELLYKTNNDLGVLYLKEERKEAKLYLEKALKYDSDPITKTKIYRNLSNHYLQFENYKQSLNHIQKSIQALVYLDTSNVKNLPSKLDLSNSHSKIQLISSLIDKSHIWIKLGVKNKNANEYLEDAITTLELADFLAEQSRLDNSDYRSKLFWRKTASEIYLNATKACFLINDPHKAFYFIEKNKAILLLEDVSLKMTRSNSNIPENITSKEQELKNKINELKKLDITTNNDSITSQVLLAKDNYNIFINNLIPDYKFYFKTLEPAKVIDIDAFRKYFFKDNNVYIEYILDDKEGYGLVITKSKIKLFEIENCNELKNNTILYRNLIDTPFKNNNSKENYKSVSNNIYKSLFPKEILPLIKDKVLTIVPDYYLQNIPFESLSTSNDDNSYLLYKNQINYAYSISFLSKNNKIIRGNSNNIIAFAPVEFSSNLASLPNTEDELRFIDKTFPSKIFLREDATTTNFFNSSNNTKIIHIASHANANDSISPWISFYDGKVNLDDIYNLKNSAELVVLSACNTSLGELKKGEGVMSLSRSFFNTGSHSVMPTLWEVNDKTSAELLSNFYNNIKQGQNKSLALHNAKLNYLETNSLSQLSPYYWASFVLIGDAGSIEIESNFSFIYYFIIAFVLLVILIFFIRRKKK